MYFAHLYLPGKLHQRNNSVVPSIFEDNVKKHPQKKYTRSYCK